MAEVEDRPAMCSKLKQTVWKTALFGDDEVLREFSRAGNLVYQKFINAVMLDNALGLSK